MPVNEPRWLISRNALTGTIHRSTLTRHANFAVATSPRRGSNNPAQGIALGTNTLTFFEALKGRDSRYKRNNFALSGLWSFFDSQTEGVALGWIVAASLGRNRKRAGESLITV